MQISMGETKRRVKDANYIVNEKLSDFREMELPINNLMKTYESMYLDSEKAS